MQAGFTAPPQDEVTVGDPASLYAMALGGGWSQLDPAVARLHAVGADSAAFGWFDVRRGTGPLVHLLACILRLPRSGMSVPLHLRIERTPAGETWHRRFAAQPCLRTKQWLLGPRLIAEQVGIACLVLAVSTDGGALHLQQVGAGIRVGGVHIPLPLAVCPRTAAHAVAADAGGIAVSVAVTLPRGRLLVAYSGVVDEVTRG